MLKKDYDRITTINFLGITFMKLTRKPLKPPHSFERWGRY